MDLRESGAAAETASPARDSSTAAAVVSSNSLVTLKVTAAPSLAAPSTSNPPGTSKIYSRNANGTVVLTSSPGNEAELQLYRVMQRASLLAYYDTLLEMGGDDVQQLCDAGEEEFLEIMALVGMATKPLHVRRLQKALQEWVTNPGLFQIPLLPASNSATAQQLSPCLVATPAHSPVRPLLLTTNSNNVPSPNAKDPYKGKSPPQERTQSISPGPSPGSPSPLQLTPVLMESQISRLAEAAEILIKSLPQFEPKPHNAKKKICRDLENVMNMLEDDPRRMEEIRKYAAIYGRFDCKRKPEKPLTLHEVSVNEAAAQICRFAPALLTRRDELFPLARQVVRDSGYHYSKHSSLTPLYRNKNGDESAKRPRLEPLSPESSEAERQRRQDRLEAIAEELKRLGEKTEELVQAAQQVRENNDLTAIHSLQQQMEIVQNKQTKLLLEQSDLLNQPLPMRFYRRSSLQRGGGENEKPDTDDTDSQMSFSNASSPLQDVGDSRDSISEVPNGRRQGGKQLIDDDSKFLKQLDSNKDHEDGFTDHCAQKVIAASGGNIIAVANPALNLSSTTSLNRLRSESPISFKMERTLD